MNKQQLTDVQLRNQYQKESDLAMGKAMADEALKQKQTYEDLMKLKKDTFSQQIKQDLEVKQRMKEFEVGKQKLEQEEAKKLQEYNTQM